MNKDSRPGAQKERGGGQGAGGAYDPAAIEGRWYEVWERSGYFQPSGDGEPRCIMIPPPNVTGSLHMGHAFQHALMDILVRRWRMAGHAVLWQTGTDHAGIATQMVVERQLEQRGEPTRAELGREAFVERVWQWKAESGDRICRQMRRLGASVDWQRERFTMDEGLSAAVLEVFVRLHEQGLIYRGKRLVNWDPHFATAISDLEVENVERPGQMWHFKYPLAADPDTGERASYEYVERDADGQIVLREMRDYISIATTRPETMLGDGAVAVHPEDKRYAPIVGKLCEIPVGPVECRRLIPIITDEYPDPDFGSGAVKITGAHDFNDHEVARRNNIPMYRLMDEHGRMRADGEPYARAASQALAAAQGRAQLDAGQVDAINLVPDELRGLERFAARRAVVGQITAEGLAVMTRADDPRLGKSAKKSGDDGGQAQVPLVEHKAIMQPMGDRSQVVIEPMLTDQWFVRTAAMGARALQAARDGDIGFVPPAYINMYSAWMENIQDWCISRQLWWGHRIPAWYDDEGRVFVGRSEDEVRAANGLGERALRRDDAVLDTWFSSALWSFSTLGWPGRDDELRRWHPTTVLVTGFDIIFFWVARMIMMSLHFLDEVPFRQAYITGLIRDDKGHKMSKSRGNIIDPLDLVDGISAADLVAKRTASLMQTRHAERIAAATRRQFPDGIQAHGADALRLTLASLASTGRDIHWDMQRLVGYRNFCNKLWNAARYVFGHCRAGDAADADGNGGMAEAWIRGQLARTLAEVSAALDAYRFDLAVAALHRFVWHQYCDWYLEISKVALQGDDQARAAATRACLVQVLETALRLLHPFIPFITEELWQQLHKRTGMAAPTASLMLAPWPTAADDAAADDAAMQWLQDMTTAARTMRAELGISPAKPLALTLARLDDAGRAHLAATAPLLRALARLDSAQALATDAARPAGLCAGALCGDVELLIPVDGIDLAAVRTRLQKRHTKMTAEHQALQKRLSSPNFATNAPAAVVATAQTRAQTLQRDLAALQRQLNTLA